MICRSRCEGCAYSAGSAANREADNRFRGIFAALGGYAFFCHDSLGWDDSGYGEGNLVTALELLRIRNNLKQAGITGILGHGLDEARQNLRVCGGWTDAVRRLKAEGWFSDERVRKIRRFFALTGAAALEKKEDGHISIDGVKDALEWLVAEMRDAGINTDFLLGTPDPAKNNGAAVAEG